MTISTKQYLHSPASQVQVNHLPRMLVWLTIGSGIAMLFSAAQLPPLRATVLALAILSIIATFSLHTTTLSMMSRMYVVLFSLPFSTTMGYLFDDEYIWWQSRWTSVLCRNHQLINEMLLTGLVGLCGMLAGMELMAHRLRKTQLPAKSSGSRPAEKINSTLSIPVVCALLAISIVLSWLHAPDKDIFSAAYASLESGAGKDAAAGLDSAWMLSYLLLVAIYVDAERDAITSAKRNRKMMLLMGTLCYIIIFLQFLRGDRECAGLIASIWLLYVTDRSNTDSISLPDVARHQLKRLITTAVPVAACIVALLVLGTLRHSASQSASEEQSLWQMIAENAAGSTWTAVALNNLGLAEEYNNGTIEYLQGETYAGYILSLPPRIITKAIGIDRPMDGDANPSQWYFGVTAMGGMHPVIVPFKNFGIWGVLGINLLCGAAICLIESFEASATFAKRCLYGCVAMSGMRWFWYGDLNIIRAVMGWAVFCVVYSLVTATRCRKPVVTVDRYSRAALTMVSYGKPSRGYSQA